MNHSFLRHCRVAATSFVLAAAAFAAAADRLPDAGIRLAGTNAVVSALDALRGMTGHLAQARDIPYPDRFARLLKEKAGLTLADRPFFFLSWLPEEMTAAATPEAALEFMETSDAVPGQLLILPVEEDGSDDFPELASDAENDAVFHRGRWFYLAERPEAKAFAERCGADPFPVLAACQAFYDTDPPARGVARAFLREPARFRPFRDGLLAKRKAFHANLARLRERAAAGEDVADELRRAEHMEVHAKAEEAIGDLLFSLLDASKFAYVDLDCDATRGLRVIRVLEGIPPSEPLDERIRLRRFLEDNIPFLAFPDPEEAAWQEARRVWHNRFVDDADQLTDIWVLPPDAVGTIANYARRFLTEPATPAAAKPAAQPDADGDGLAAAGCAAKPATSCATVAVTRVVPSETEIPGRILPFDPIFLRSQFDVIRSTPVLSPVVLSNDLASVLDAAYGWHMACPDAAADRAVACLRTWTNLSIWKDTDLIGIEVSVDRAVPGAEALSRKLAGDIARSYRANAIALREAETKATAAQLQSDIDFVQKRIAESEPKDRQALESRLSKLRERLGWYGTWYGTLVPYVDVRIMDDPERPGSGTRGPDAEKWKRIVLPVVDFRQSSVVDVVAELEDLARNYDDFVAAARGQGVTFVLDVPADAVDSLPLVTCKMKSVSVYSAIDTIAEMSGLEWSVDGDVIRLTLAPGRPAAEETHAEAEDGVDSGCFGDAPSAEN